MQGGHRASFNALAAVHAVDVTHAKVKSGAYFGVKAAMGERQNAQALYLVTGADTTPAEDTFARITHYGRGELVDGHGALGAFKADAVDTSLFT